LGLKSITNPDIISGFRIDLSNQLSKHFQLGGMWHYSKAETEFSLNTAVISNSLTQDSDFIAGTYHDNGKLESRGMLKLTDDVNLCGEIMFPGTDPTKAYYAVELAAKIRDSLAGIKVGAGMRTFSYMQLLATNTFAGFECTYMVKYL